MIYISQKFGGDPERKREAEKLIKVLSILFQDETFISPILTFGHMYFDVPYDRGMKYCTDLLSKCDKMWVFGEHSTGVIAEIDFCEKHGIPWEQVDE